MGDPVRDSGVCEKCGAHGNTGHGLIEGDCQLPHRLDGVNHPPAASIGWACTHCLERHRSWLTEIVELYAGLPFIAEFGPAEDQVGEHKRPKKRPASPAPIRLEAWAMLNDTRRLHAHGPRRNDMTFEADYVHTATPDVTAVLSGWVDVLYEEKGETHVGVSHVSSACALLDLNAEVMAASPHIVDYDDELRWLRIALRRVHGLSDPRPFGDCLGKLNGDDCQGKVWRDQDDPRGKPMRCDRCRRPYSKLDAVRLAAEVRRKATA